MTYSTKEISDGGSEPNTPTVTEMRESQRKGSAGKGLAEQSNRESQAAFNLSEGADTRPSENVSGLEWLGR
jgi:hypothetical protein